MNDNTKTALFVGAALLVGLLAFASAPRAVSERAADVRGQLLVDDKDFNPDKIARLEVTEFNEADSTVRKFEVAKTQSKGQNIWTIPSHDDYPTDAKDQFANAATAFLGAKILEKASDNPGQHAEYGVVDPDPAKRKIGDTGIGERITMTGEGDKRFVDVIVGKQAPGGPDLHYVRRAGDDAVYVVALKMDKFNTKFENWIERNLLKISSWEINQVAMHDYAVDALRGTIDDHGQIRVAYNDTGEPKWKLLGGTKGDTSNEPLALGANEELNAQKLDDLRYALDDLKIVDVRRKPAGLSADLKASADFKNSAEAVESLGERGFNVAEIDGQVGVYSNQGEVQVQMKDGVVYVLRFGGIAMGSDHAKPKDGEAAGENRYLFVMAQFNPEAIAKPQLEPLPEEKPAAPPATDAAAKSDAAKTDAAAKEGAPQDEHAKDDAKPAAASTPPLDPEKLKAERARIEKENQRKTEEYEDQVKKGQERVQELNERFADWYYVISNDVFKKIHLPRNEIIVPKKADKKDAKAGDGPLNVTPPADDPMHQLDTLKSEGIEAH